MLDFGKKMNDVVIDNEISINGFVIGKCTDEVANKIVRMVIGSLKMPTEKKNFAPEEGELLYGSDTLSVRKEGKEYRLYIITTFPKIRNGIKYTAKEQYGAKYSGDYKAGKVYWTFPDKKAAQSFITAQKKRDAEKK